MTPAIDVDPHLDEALYGDDRKWRNAPTAVKAERQALADIKRLRRSCLPDAGQLADELLICRPAHRCYYAPCAMCSRASQRAVTFATLDLFRDVPTKARVEPVRICIVPPDISAPMGELSTIDFDHLAATVQNALEASGAVLFAVLGLDISLNDERQKGLGLGWNPHYHGFALTNDAPHLLRVLQAAYPPSVYVHAPIDLGSYDRSVYATSYAFKPVPYRRVSYFDANHYPYPCWNTRHTSLKAREHVEFLLHARELGFARRLILHRVAVTNSNGFLTMKKHE